MSQYVLPDLFYDYGDLEPHLSGKIMQLHHDQHHRAYVEGANRALEQLLEARERQDFGQMAWLEQAGTIQIHDHQSNIMQASIPLLVIDAWEHAYYLQYQTKKAKYFEGLWRLWHWDDVAMRYANAERLNLALADVAEVTDSPAPQAELH